MTLHWKCNFDSLSFPQSERRSFPHSEQRSFPHSERRSFCFFWDRMTLYTFRVSSSCFASNMAVQQNSVDYWWTIHWYLKLLSRISMWVVWLHLGSDHTAAGASHQGRGSQQFWDSWADLPRINDPQVYIAGKRVLKENLECTFWSLLPHIVHHIVQTTSDISCLMCLWCLG